MKRLWNRLPIAQQTYLKQYLRTAVLGGLDAGFPIVIVFLIVSIICNGWIAVTTSSWILLASITIAITVFLGIIVLLGTFWYESMTKYCQAHWDQDVNKMEELL